MAQYMVEPIADGARGDERPKRRPVSGDEPMSLAARHLRLEPVEATTRQLQALRAQLAESEAKRRALEQRLAALESSRPLTKLVRR